MRGRAYLIHEINSNLIGRGAAGTVEFDNVEIDIIVLFGGCLQLLKNRVSQLSSRRR